MTTRQHDPRAGGLVLATTAAAVAFVVLVSGGVYLWERGRVRDLQVRLDVAQTRIAELTKALDEASTAQPPPLDGSQTTSSGPSGGSGAEDADESAAPSGTTRQFAFVKKLERVEGRVRATVDYAQLLTGTAAAEAASARGDESPPPNDYYVVNDNTRLRTFMVGPEAEVLVSTWDDGTYEEPKRISADRFYEAFASPEDRQYVVSRPYWLTITNGEITRIEEQYVP